jgi:hypothetical protein
MEELEIKKTNQPLYDITRYKQNLLKITLLPNLFIVCSCLFIAIVAFSFFQNLLVEAVTKILVP